MTAKDLQQYVGKRIKEVEYVPGGEVAYLITEDGFGIEYPVEPTYDEEDDE